VAGAPLGAAGAWHLGRAGQRAESASPTAHFIRRKRRRESRASEKQNVLAADHAHDRARVESGRLFDDVRNKAVEKGHDAYCKSQQSQRP